MDGQNHDRVDCRSKVDGAWKPPKNGSSRLTVNRREGERSLGNP